MTLKLKLKPWLMPILLLATNLLGEAALQLHPANNRYFQFEGKTVVLMGSSEHYGALVNLDFDYIRYLEETRASGLNFVRIFTGTYVEYQGAFNIVENTLVPAPGRFVAPWKRSDVTGAAGGGNKFDLTRWDAAFFYRLREFVRAASQRGIVVELTLFGTFYDEGSWAVSPMNAANHINGVGAGGRAACYTTTSDLLPFHRALARKCATELRDFDNVILEVCNEPYINSIPVAWENRIIDELVLAEASFPRRHLLAQNVANFEGVISAPHPAISLFNFHYAKPAAASANRALNRPIGDDETGFAGVEDFPYRKEAWEFLLAGGALFNHLDYSYTSGREDGLASQPAPGGGGPGIRRQLGVLRWFLEELPLVEMSPQTGFVTGGVPSGGAARTLSLVGQAYALYLTGGTQATLTVSLPAGTYQGHWIDPRSGLVTGTVAEFSHGGGAKSLVTPAYSEDIALRLSGGGRSFPQAALTAPSYKSIIASEAASVTLSATASVAGGTLAGVEFWNGEQLLGTVTAPPFEWVVNGFSRGSHILRARALASDGSKGISPPVNVDVRGPFQAGVNLSGAAVYVNGDMLQSEAAGIAAGMVIENASSVSTTASLTYYPDPNPPTESVLRSNRLRFSGQGNTPLGLSYPLPAGHYDVFLFVAENDASHSREMRVTIEGETVARFIGDLSKGEWRRYGPYRTQVADSALTIGLQQETKGVPQIAAFAIYQADGPPAYADVEMKIGTGDGVVVLSYPAMLPDAKVETSDSLSGGWQELTAPVSSFSDFDVVPVPTDSPSRFFRLRMD